MLTNRLFALSAIAIGLSFTVAPARALTMAECSAKYNSARDAGTLEGMTWNQFRKAECGVDTTAGAPPKATNGETDAATSDSAAPKGLTAKECSIKYNAAKEADPLDGTTWNEFRKAECGPGATTAEGSARKTAAAALEENTGTRLSMKECSVRYRNAKADDSLKGMKWNEFRKNECGGQLSDDDTVPALDEVTYTDEPETPIAKVPSGVKFPKEVSAKFSDETPAKARMRTCLEQYYANKDADALGGLRWIQKGGGYYSLCNARLKSES